MYVALLSASTVILVSLRLTEQVAKFLCVNFELMSVSVTDNMRNNIVRTREVRSGSCGPFYMNLPHALQLHT